MIASTLTPFRHDGSVTAGSIGQTRAAAQSSVKKTFRLGLSSRAAGLYLSRTISPDTAVPARRPVSVPWSACRCTRWQKHLLIRSTGFRSIEGRTVDAQDAYSRT